MKKMFFECRRGQMVSLRVCFACPPHSSWRLYRSWYSMLQCMRRERLLQ